MVTVRQIKARFRRSHLLKLANDMLLKDLSSKPSDGKWFSLRPGRSAEDLVDCVSFEGFSNEIDKIDSEGKHWHTCKANFLSLAVDGNGVVYKHHLKVDVVYDDDWRVAFHDKFVVPGWSGKFRSAPYQYQLDELIVFDLFRFCFHIIKDNSEISI